MVDLGQKGESNFTFFYVQNKKALKKNTLNAFYRFFWLFNK
jgi:hypothetical protein